MSYYNTSATYTLGSNMYTTTSGFYTTNVYHAPSRTLSRVTGIMTPFCITYGDLCKYIPIIEKTGMKYFSDFNGLLMSIEHDEYEYPAAPFKVRLSSLDEIRNNLMLDISESDLYDFGVPSGIILHLGGICEGKICTARVKVLSGSLSGKEETREICPFLVNGDDALGIPSCYLMPVMINSIHR